ncbi:P-loop containing nucleoside triphosphate hydrolase protein [Lyophyllum atratum]|nr:P-loop containing nucleoside triphosphate hydrolase protein [Lyophyllum atratum]
MAEDPILPKAIPRMPSSVEINPAVRRVARGIFSIVYDSSPCSRINSFNLPSHDELRSYGTYIQSMWRFICEVCDVAPSPFICYSLFSLWIAVAPAIALILCYSALDIIEEAVVARDLSDDGFSQLKYLILTWLLVEVSSAMLRRCLDDVALKLTGHLKAHFLPQLAKANLNLDIEYIRGRIVKSRFMKGANHHSDTRQAILHEGWSSHDNVNGLDIIQHLFNRARGILALSMQLLALLSIIYRDESHGAQVLMYLLLTYFTLAFVKYIVGTQGFLFFTDNADYHRQLSLHTMIYGTRDQPMYRQAIAKDGIGRYLGDEYCRVSNDLGIVSETPWHLATRPRSTKLYWLGVIQSLVIDCPLSLFTFMLPLGLSASSLATMSFFQYATALLRETARAVENASHNGSFKAIMSDADRLYEVLDNIHNAGIKQGYKSYPAEKSSPLGMKLSFRNVSLWYENQILPALDNISVDIAPGQLVLIVGVNGSGKSSLLNLLLRLVEPTSGEIFIDGDALRSYNTQVLRRAMTFLSQTDTAYPLSIRENLLVGFPYGQVDPRKLERAAEAGGCLDLLRNQGDAVIDPPRIVSQSFNQGAIGPEAMAFIQLHNQKGHAISLSEGQKQRMVAARMFYRAINTDFRLLVVDEPASSMDAAAERKLYGEFRRVRNNKTTILVAHHFQPLAKQADLILCMANGRIVQRGSHTELINDEKGEYARLYNAQSSGLE